MKPFSLMLTVLLMLFCSSTIFSQKILNGVVIVTAYDESGGLLHEGAGIIVGKENTSAYILTAYHVIEGGKTFKIQLSGPRKRTYPAQLYGSVEKELDIAVLESVITFTAELDFYKFKKYSGKKIQPNERVALIGHPYGESWSYNDLNYTKKSDAPYEVKITNEFVDPGNSGGPLLLKNNERFIGMVTRVQGNGALAVRSDEILWYLDQWGVPYNLVKRPIKKATYFLGGGAIGALVAGYKFNERGVETYDLYETFRDPVALDNKHNTTQEALLKEAKREYTYRNIAYGVSFVAVVVAVLNEFDVFDKKDPKIFLPGVGTGQLQFRSTGTGVGLVWSF